MFYQWDVVYDLSQSSDSLLRFSFNCIISFLLLLLTRCNYMYMTNIINGINNYSLAVYKYFFFYIKAFTNFHRFNYFLFHRKSHSIDIMLNFTFNFI